MKNSNNTLHYWILIAIFLLTIVRIILWNVPNNKLHEMGLGNAISFDMSVGVLFALSLAIISLIYRKTARSKTVFFLSQFLAWANSIGVWVGIIGIAFYTAMNGGV